MLIVACATIFIAIAMILLVLEQLFLTPGSSLENEFLGIYVFGGIATTVSGFAVVSFDLFTFKMVFPEKTKILTFLASIAMSIYIME